MTEAIIKDVTSLYKQLAALPGIELFLLAPDAIYGSKGFDALRLIANALYESLPGKVDRKTVYQRYADSNRLVLADALFERCRGVDGLEFICCYHFQGEPGWYLRYSEEWSERDPAQALVEIIRHDLLTNQCGE